MYKFTGINKKISGKIVYQIEKGGKIGGYIDTEDLIEVNSNLLNTDLNEKSILFGTAKNSTIENSLVKGRIENSEIKDSYVKNEVRESKIINSRLRKVGTIYRSIIENVDIKGNNLGLGYANIKKAEDIKIYKLKKGRLVIYRGKEDSILVMIGTDYFNTLVYTISNFKKYLAGEKIEKILKVEEECIDTNRSHLMENLRIEIIEKLKEQKNLLEL